MIEPLIAAQARAWLAKPGCAARPLLAYMRSTGKLRDVQVAALQTYLFLLLEGQNQSLPQLWQQGTFVKPARHDGPRSRMPQIARDTFAHNPAAHTWYQLLQAQQPAVASWLEENADQPDYAALTQQLFYGWQNTDYVFSLPMGSGKTWLMAAIIYLNLYLREQLPGDARFARNFALLIPSAKKSSILPSLRSIERFDPAWVIAEPAASRLRHLLHFEVLDAARTAAKSNQTRNPNARRVASHLANPELTGLVLVVNAEKVILNRIDDSTPELVEKTEDERDLAANELRALIGRLPGLQLIVDEVHGAATSEIRLRQVIQRWHAAGNVHSVLGFSGTPYLDKPQEIALGQHTLKQKQISTVVFHYPLAEAVRTFLKQPEVRTAHGLDAPQIVQRGTEAFLQRYGRTVYPDGCTAKLAVYCGTIERLETEVAPMVERLFPGQTLKYHRGNTHYKAPLGAEAAFAALDSPASAYRVVLLVQIGKEGWDCRSLSSVILAQKGDSPANMVLQSACRCLREVVRGQRHSALIYLSHDNALILEAQLKNTQNTSIAALNAAAGQAPATTPTHSRMGWLQSMEQLPLIEAYQLRLNTQTPHTEADARTADKLAAALQRARHRQTTAITTGTLEALSVRSTRANDLGAPAEFAGWLHNLVSESLGMLSHQDLQPWRAELLAIFEALTDTPPGSVPCSESNPRRRDLNTQRRWDPNTQRRWVMAAPQEDVRRLCRLAFWRLREFTTEVHALDTAQQMLLLKTARLPAEVALHDKLYPDAAQVQKIIDADAKNECGAAIAKQENAQFEAARALLASQGMAHLMAAQSAVTASAELTTKDQSFHYLPYDFAQSGLELALLQELLKSTEFQATGLEVYYNGARHLTEFRIDCYRQVGAATGTATRWQKLGAYTPDFVMLQRSTGGAVHKVLIIEAKGAGFAEQTAYTDQKKFVASEFVRLNNDKFGYSRFDFCEVPEPANKQYAGIALPLLAHAFAFFDLNP
ncbi:MAG: hypothetical protein EAZ34_08020 [Polaromonas sp.]|nr:MAG: hypothetical protein EAZ34_08020 [Polaromonas sp.]